MHNKIKIGLLSLAAAVFFIGGVSAAEPAGEPGRAVVRLLTEAQYRNTITNIFGPDIQIDVRFAPPRRTKGLLALNAANAGVSASDAEAFHRVGYALAAQIVDEKHRAYLMPCRPADAKAADDACSELMLKRLGRLLYRRSLTDAELKGLVTTAGTAATKFNDFYAGLTYGLGSVLASPNFLFVVEQTEPDPASPGNFRLTGSSLAARLSLFLWNSLPDEDLLAAAESGKLHNPKTLAAQVGGMIASPRFENGVRAFFSDMLAFEDFANLAKDAMIYPNFTGRAVEDSAEQTLKVLVDHVVDKDADYRDVFTSRTTFLTPNLAPLYGVPAKAAGWARYELPADSERRGLLMQVGFLAAHSHPGRSSPTKRGKALRELLLCQTVPEPPPNVDFSLFEDPAGNYKTARDRLVAHSQNPVCAGCHKITDRMGLALENFDGAGQFRTAENGTTIDPAGDLDGAKFTSPRGLAQAMHDNPAVTSCLVNRVFSYALGRPSSQKDAELLADFGGRFGQDGYRVKSLMSAIATSKAMSRVANTQLAEASQQ